MTGTEPCVPVPFDVVAIASSAGGIHALMTLLASFQVGFPAPVLIVQHLDSRHRTVLADLLNRRCELDVKLAEPGEPARSGTVYIAPPNRHLLVSADRTLSLTSTEPVNFVRPAADLLFESVATEYGPRAIVCVLTGTGKDGALGAKAVKSRGGTVIAQDPASAEFSGMPSAAVATGAVDFMLPITEIAGVICGLVGSEPG